jgi:EAL domain-containing protein (putative c-di-GMP-specific phosphodiesterase class I)
VLRTACRQINDWHSRGLPRTSVSVNLSSRQLRHETLVRTIKKVLADMSFDPQDLEFELTESFLMDDVPRSKSTP